MNDNEEKVWGGCLIAVLTILAITAVLLLPTHSITVPVTDTYWVREQQVENYVPRSYTDWEWNVPSDAYNKSAPYSALYSSSTSCSKVGKSTFCTTHHTYRNKVDYTADRWGYERSIIVNGHNNNPVPYWPALDFVPCDQLHCERAGGQTERYTITYERDDKSTFTCDTTTLLYGEFMPKQRYQIQDGLLVHIPRCDTLKLSH